MGKIQVVRVGSEARVPRAEIERLLGQTDERPDLDRQIEWLEAWRCPEAVVVVTHASL